MKYGLTFLVDIYDFDTQVETQIVTRPSDYIQMKLWADKDLEEGLNEDVRDLRTNYATVWFALKREGRLEEFGVADEISAEAVDSMASRMAVYVTLAPEGSLPLAKGRKK